MEVGRRRAGQFASMSWGGVAVRAACWLAPALAGLHARKAWRPIPLPVAVKRCAGSAFVHAACPQVGVAAGGLTPQPAPDPGCRGRCGGPGKAGPPVRAEMQAVRRQRHQALPENAAGAGPAGLHFT